MYELYILNINLNSIIIYMNDLLYIPVFSLQCVNTHPERGKTAELGYNMTNKAEHFVWLRMN